MPVATATNDSSSGSGGRIAFVSAGDADSDIFIMDSDGTDQERLTDNDWPDSYPTWSPDGMKLAFSTIRETNEEFGATSDQIYVMDSDGSDQKRLSKDGVWGFWPRWSPDGLKIAFLSIRDGERDLYVVNSDGSHETRLTNDPSDESSPNWSPNSKQITFARDGEIYVINVDSKSEVNLTNSQYDDSSPAWSPDGTKILFVSSRGQSDSNVYLMNNDGSNQTGLSGDTQDTPRGIQLAWSPHGDKIFFVAVGKGSLDIFMMDADGSDPINLSNSLNSDTFPAIQPIRHFANNGSIVFTRTREQGNTQLYTMTVEGLNVTRISSSLENSDSYPSWSPDGTKILFQSIRGADSDIYVMDHNGNNETKLLQSALFDTYPSWSSDASKIVYVASSGTTDGNLYTIRVDGSDQELVTDMAGDDTYPSFSPDGSRIVFSHFETDNYEIYVIDTDGTNAVNLTNIQGDDTYPSWSPDGQKIVFESTRDNNSEIYVVDPDGSDLIRLTDDPATDFSPKWSADGTKITFARVRNGGDAEIYIMDADGTDTNRVRGSSHFDSQPHLGAGVFEPSTGNNSNISEEPSEEIDLAIDSFPKLAITVVRIFAHDNDARNYPSENVTSSAIHPNDKVVINSVVQNVGRQTEHFDYVVEVIDSDGIVRAISIRQNVAIPLGQSIPIDTGGAIELGAEGDYTIKIFALTSLSESPTPLSLIKELSVTVENQVDGS